MQASLTPTLQSHTLAHYSPMHITCRWLSLLRTPPGWLASPGGG